MSSVTDKKTGPQNGNGYEYGYEYKINETRTMRILTADGLFSPGGVDKGTAAMLSVCDFSSDDTVLDLGCGAGVVGLTAAAGGARVTMSDIDGMAVGIARKNASGNLTEEEFSRVDFIESDGFNKIENKRFTKILSNPPYHTDFSVAKRFIEGAFEHMAVGGSLYMVTKRLDWYKNKLTSVFGGVKVYEHQDGYYVFVSQKRGGTAFNRSKNGSKIIYKRHNDDVDHERLLDFVEYEFNMTLAESWSDEGRHTFGELIKHAKIFPAFNYYEAFDDVKGKTAGVLAVDKGFSHVTLLFVDKKYSRRGIGSKLLSFLERDCTCGGLTVNAEPSAVGFYLKAGFRPVRPGTDGLGEIDEKDGIRTVRMFKKIKRQTRKPAASADDRT